MKEQVSIFAFLEGGEKKVVMETRSVLGNV